eukprot:CAMPEP_0114442186 /NCGR_PEP_ID=MMETSP0103-20121206/16803_1 /TAXON_ID=37642 ORGANISM="Paraphysomonas imperforata, Strain PA2" /NCGR_SAMPLE_ID=MMETSP0103 /ASSEMBLY_ACC=CAM_ASM_000201 /LENGTH=217 /DNA_ID=CAMNT_0001613409 /DNA_START=152 /DNA_END=805 /DNA_ORIENTATION=+
MTSTTEETEEGCALSEERQQHIVIKKGELENKRVLIIGDVHGCLDELVALLAKCNYDADVDQVVLVGDLDSEDVAWLQHLPWTITLEDFNAIVVHAGVVPQKPLAEQSLNDLTKMRNVKSSRDSSKAEVLEATESVNNGGVAWSSVWAGPEHVYFGHDAVRGLQQFPFCTGLDTGCCYGRSLTAITLPGQELFQVEALEVYQIPGSSSSKKSSCIIS